MKKTQTPLKVAGASWSAAHSSVVIRCSLTAFLLWSIWMLAPTLNGKSHGNRENMVKSSILLKNDYFSNSNPMPLSSRQPCTVEPDYHMLYQLDYVGQKKYGGHFNFALYDPNRMLGIPLWGSLITEPLNPLHMILGRLPFGWSVALKTLIYFIMASVGAGLLALSLANCSALSSWIAGTFYMASSYMFFFIHWQNGLGVASLAPGAIWILLQWLQSRNAKWLIGWFFVLIWMILMNMVQVFAHFCLFTLVFTVTWLIISDIGNLEQRFLRAVVAGLVALCALIFCGGYIVDILVNGRFEK